MCFFFTGTTKTEYKENMAVYENIRKFADENNGQLRKIMLEE